MKTKIDSLKIASFGSTLKNKELITSSKNRSSWICEKIRGGSSLFMIILNAIGSEVNDILSTIEAKNTNNIKRNNLSFCESNNFKNSFNSKILKFEKQFSPIT